VTEKAVKGHEKGCRGINDDDDDDVRFAGSLAVTMKNAVFWDITQCRLRE
jgi:hypothetical protein